MTKWPRNDLEVCLTFQKLLKNTFNVSFLILLTCTQSFIAIARLLLDVLDTYYNDYIVLQAMGEKIGIYPSMLLPGLIAATSSCMNMAEVETLVFHPLTIMLSRLNVQRSGRSTPMYTSCLCLRRFVMFWIISLQFEKFKGRW